MSQVLEAVGRQAGVQSEATGANKDFHWGPSSQCSCPKAGLAIPLLEATCKAGISTDIFVSGELGGLSAQRLILLINRRHRGLRNRQISPTVH